MSKASSRKRKNRIVSLEQDEVEIEGDAEIRSYATSFYKDMFSVVIVLSNVDLNVPMPFVLYVVDGDTLSKPFTLEK
jgi:hypothetical protein